MFLVCTLLSMTARELISIIQNIALTSFGASILPVYRFDDEEPVHIGTCFAVEFADRRFLITAAHVLDHRKQGPLAVGAASELVEVQGTWFISNPGARPREDDPIDFAWHELTKDEATSLSCIPAAALEDSQGSSRGVRLLTMIGYPVSKNKKLSPEARKLRRIQPKRAQYTDTEAIDPAYFARRGMSALTHVAMKRSNRARENDGTVVNTISHRGLSGGPLIYTGLSISPPSIGNQLIVGIILEGDESGGVVVALRLSVVLHHIKSQLGITN